MAVNRKIINDKLDYCVFHFLSGYDFHEDDATLLGNIRYNKIDLLVEKFNEKLYQHFNIEKGWFSGYPSGRVEYKQNSSTPFFIMMNLDTLKLPLNPEEKFEAMYPYQEDEKRRQYLASVSNMDDAVGRMISHIRKFYYLDGENERNLYDDTVVIFTSVSAGLTTGPVFTGSSNTPLSGQQGDFLEGGTKVPAFITNIGKAGHADTMVHVSDWLPTIYLGLARGNTHDSSTLDGINQIDVLRGTSEDLRTELLYDVANFNSSELDYTHVTSPEWPENFRLTGAFGAALRDKKFKLIVGCSTRLGCSRNYNSTWNGNMSLSQTQLFDLVTDPQETTDLAKDEQYQTIVSQMKARINWHLQRSVNPLHSSFENSGLPLYSFPPGQFFTGWCDDTKFDVYKNTTTPS